MVLERKLMITIDEFDKLTERFKWRFMEHDNETIRIEVPKGDEELLVLEVTYSDKLFLKLKEMGFILQNKEWVP